MCLCSPTAIPLRVLTPSAVAAARQFLAHTLFNRTPLHPNTILSLYAPANTTPTDHDQPLLPATPTTSTPAAPGALSPPDYPSSLSSPLISLPSTALPPPQPRRRRRADTDLSPQAPPPRRRRPPPGSLAEDTLALTNVPQPIPPSVTASPCPHDPANNKFFVGKSEDPADAGWGLFARHNISCTHSSKHPQLLCEYSGRINPPDPSQSYTYEFSTAPHKFTRVDAFDPITGIVLCLAGYINDPLDEDRENATFFVHKGRLWIIPTRDIRAGEQIFVHYGRDYWASDQWPLHLLQQVVRRYINSIDLSHPLWAKLKHTPDLWPLVYNRPYPITEVPPDSSLLPTGQDVPAPTPATTTQCRRKRPLETPSLPTTVEDTSNHTHTSQMIIVHTDPTSPDDAEHTADNTDLSDNASTPAPPLPRRRLDLIVNATPGTQESLPQAPGPGDADSVVMYSPIVDRSAYDVLTMHALINSRFCTDDLRASLFSPSVVIAQPPLYDIDLDENTTYGDTHFDKHLADS